ncbi:YciI family protein [Cellulomonas sp.]|uniref:YciI family protein n=1 Tax=Cellulomonas sp. TaxID=40001 RepID=UPI003BAD3E0F
MRYFTTLRVTAQPTTPPPPALFEAIMALGAEATAAGALLDTAGLMPSAADGARVHSVGGRLTVSDGPFAETKELISYAIYDVRSRDEAVEWATRFVRLHQEHWDGWAGEADVLRVYEP